MSPSRPRRSRGTPARRALLASGHMTDAPGRAAERFPQRQVPAVTARIAAALDAWHVGAGTTVVCGGARGADIIIAEEGLRRGAAVHVCLALPAEQFRATSAEIPGTDWGQRFDALLAVAEVSLVPQQDASDGLAYARANDFMVDLARSIDPQPYAVFVWDGKQGDGPGGTADQVARLGYALDDPHVHLIDPRPPA